MELFGVQELPNAKSISAPGWAYVPDTGINPSVAALQPSQAKRARNLRNPSVQENSAKQDAKILRELAALDKESHKDVQIPVPVKHRDNSGRASHGKVTPAVRKILQSQKTFANHLSDAEALASLTAPQPQSQPIPAPPLPVSRASPASTSTPALPEKIPGKRGPYKKKNLNARAASTPLREVTTPNPGLAGASLLSPQGIKTETSNADVAMSDPPNELLAPLPTSYQLTAHPGDKDPLLISYIPSVPSQADLEKLIAAPPLTYMEAKGELTDEDLRRPTRSFCEICGYWGRVKCMKCGTRVCALECLRTHQEDCYTRYGL